jgi:hypothetical protein
VLSQAVDRLMEEDWDCCSAEESSDLGEPGKERKSLRTGREAMWPLPPEARPASNRPD